jgi:pimeloyl-ACP methyl ester carboxylesterase
VPRLVVFTIISMLVLSTAPASARHQAATPPVIRDSGDGEGLVDIGDGRRLYLECRGVGSPTVILEAGAGNNGEIWDAIALPQGTNGEAVLPGVATFTRVCVYDRPGTFLDAGEPGRSDPVAMPRTAADMVADLHALLQVAGVPGPYVVAGHSFGGLVARLFASTFPDEVVGLVLIDSAHEDYYDLLQETLTPEQWELSANPPVSTDYPDMERIDTGASAIQMREAAAASPLRAMPLVVLTHGRAWDWPADYPAAALEAIWAPLQADLASLVPGGQLVVAGESQHYIQVDQPDLVIASIWQVVSALRDPAS